MIVTTSTTLGQLVEATVPPTEYTLGQLVTALKSVGIKLKQPMAVTGESSLSSPQFP
jgi:hypothetical protein